MNIILKIIIIIIVLAGMILLGIFIKDKYSGKDQSIISGSPGVLPYNPSISDEKAVKQTAENFVSGYGSYQKGNFSSLKEVKKMMTKKYKEETERFIEEKEQEQNNASAKEYITYISIPEQTIIVSINEVNAEVSVNFEQNIFYGAHIYLNGNLATVDQNGNQTMQALKRESAKKQATILIVKEGDLWKVDSIKIK